MKSKPMLIIGGGALAAARAFAALDADSEVTIITEAGYAGCCEELQWRSDARQVMIYDYSELPYSPKDNAPMDLETFRHEALEAYLAAMQNSDNPILFACVTDTITGTPNPRTQESATKLFRMLRSFDILVNMTDMPALCNFSFTSTHRFDGAETGTGSPLQIGITTNGKGCRLATRLKREIVAKLPKDVGAAVENVGKMRMIARQRDGEAVPINPATEEEDDVAPTPNTPVPLRQHHQEQKENPAERSKRRMEWIAQLSEFWPISALARLTEDEIKNLLSGDQTPPGPSFSTSSFSTKSLHDLSILHPPSAPKKGQIILAGSGTGHPSLLTIATHQALQAADLVLSDKLVPESVLKVIPSHVEIRIARKFPGNSEGAMQEMMEAALDAAKRGLRVVRVCVTSSYSLRVHFQLTIGDFKA
jgi:uroporphyrin-III C-methyltransferase